MKDTIKTLVVELNIFKHQGSNEQQMHYERLATRLYILLLIVASVILASFSLLIEEFRRETIINPTKTQYNDLQKTYQSASLSCPCQSISMNYSSFLDIYPVYHQVCSSDFVTDAWLQYLAAQADARVFYHAYDYRPQISSYFQLLRVFCESARKTVDDARQNR